MEETAAEEKQIQVRFVTKLPPELHVAATPFSLPAHLTRYGLSEVVNALLGLEEPQPFDFLVDGELLRTSLEQLLLTNKLSAESILNVEYAYAVGPPVSDKSCNHKDWVSAVTGGDPRFIATGSYDSHVRIWGGDGSAVQSLEGHCDAISSLDVFIPSGSEKQILVSGSKDHTARLWQLSSKNFGKVADTLITLDRPVRVLKGHTSSVQCVALNDSGSGVCSGSWDCSIKLWINLLDESEHNLIVHSKKRKLDATVEWQELEVGASTTLKGHTQCVSAVNWGNRDAIVSASWDQSIRNWDIETNINTETLIGSKAFHCLSVGGDNMALFAAGGADPVLRIWDPRMPGTNKPIIQLSSHKSWIAACKWHRQSRHHILSASYDGSVKLWDLRSKIPLQTIEAHKGKVLCADWWKSNSFISGGTDNCLQVFSSLQIS